MAVAGSSTASQSTEIADLYRRYSGWLIAKVRRDGWGDAAEDIVQETFAKLAHYPFDTGVRHPQAFLFKAAQNLARNAARSALAAKNVQPAFNPLDATHAGADQFEAVLLKQTILGLPESYRDVFVLSRFGGMSNEEVARACNLSVKAVVQMKKKDGRFRITEVWYEPLRKRALAA